MRWQRIRYDASQTTAGTTGKPKKQKKLTLLQAPHHTTMVGAQDAWAERLCIDSVPSSRWEPGQTRVAQVASREIEKAACFGKAVE